ncbi:hypothetical protein ABZ767_18480 [Streptomyces pseudogriseolus]|uniref:hypothetical protein n=1 Tax=Streptomyces pseudogriseolus TaxID=36817 RepID=UPI0034738D3D
MTYALAAIYAATLVEVFTLACVAVRIASPEKPTPRTSKYKGTALRHMAHDRYVREAARAEARNA